MDSENSDSGAPASPATFGQRHGLTIMVAVMGALFVLVMIVQVLA